MKVLSLTQPWASLTIKAYKQIETRGWHANFRGPLLIHATAGKPDGYTKNRFEKMPEFMEIAEKERWNNWEALPYGQILGAVELVGTNPTEVFTSYFKKHAGSYISSSTGLPIANIDDQLTEAERVISRFIDMPARELLFGDYSPNRQGWVLKNAVEFGRMLEGMFFPDYIPAKGNLSIWQFELPVAHSGYFPLAWQKFL